MNKMLFLQPVLFIYTLASSFEPRSNFALWLSFSTNGGDRVLNIFGMKANWVCFGVDRLYSNSKYRSYPDHESEISSEFQLLMAG